MPRTPRSRPAVEQRPAPQCIVGTALLLSLAIVVFGSVPAASASIVWKADAEASMASEWASSSSVPWAASPPNPDPTRIAQSSFRAQGLRSYRFEMRNGDDSYGERAELAQGMPAIAAYQNRWFRAGEERWIALQYYLPADWPNDNTWQTILNMKATTPGGGGPSIGLDAGYGGSLKFYGNTNAWGSTAGAIFDGAGPLTGGVYPLTRNRWMRFTFHVKFSADPAVGFVEVFGDLADGRGMRTLVPLRRRATMKYLDGVMQPEHLRVGIYRDPAMTATQSLFVDGITVATTRAEAESNAYGSQPTTAPPPPPAPPPPAPTDPGDGETDPPGDVLWKADGELAMATEWASSMGLLALSPPNPDPSRIAQSSYRAQGLRSYRLEVRDGDSLDHDSERSELAQGAPALKAYEDRWFYAGEDRWLALQYYLPAEWPRDDTWQTILQIQPVSSDGGGPVIGLDAGYDGHLKFYGNTNDWGSAEGRIFDGAGPLGGSYPLPKGRWIKLTYHIGFSADPSRGFVEVFGDLRDGWGMRTLVPRRTRATMKYRNGVMDPVHLRVGIYRDIAIPGAQSLYVDGVTVAATRAAAELNAYRGP